MEPQKRDPGELRIQLFGHYKYLAVTFRTNPYDTCEFRASRPDDTRIMDFFPWRKIGVPQVSAIGMCNCKDYWTIWFYNWIWDPRVVEELVQRRYNFITHVDTRLQQYINMQAMMIGLNQKSEEVPASQIVDDVSDITCMVCTNEMLDDDMRTKICGSENCSALVCGSCASKLKRCPTCRVRYGKPPFAIMSDPEFRQYKSNLIESSKMSPPKAATEPTIVKNCQVEFNAFVPSELPHDLLKDYFHEIEILIETFVKYKEVNDLWEKSTIENHDRYFELKHTFSQLELRGTNYEEASFRQRTTRLTRSEIIDGVNYHDKLDTLREYFLNAHSERYSIMKNLWSMKHQITSTLDRIGLLRQIDRRIPSTATFCYFCEEIIDEVHEILRERRKMERELKRLSSDLKLIEAVNKRVCIQRGEGGSWCRHT